MSATDRTCTMCTATYANGTYRMHRVTHPAGLTKRGARLRKPRRDAFSDRNRAIVEAIKGGAYEVAVAARFGITRQRVHQVWVKWGDGSSSTSHRDIPIRHVLCTCGGFRLRDRSEGHFETDEHLAYLRMRFVRRFWSSITVRPDGCWEWVGAVHSQTGYGRVSSMTGRPFGGPRVDYAHRISYQLVVGPIPDGLNIDHLCRFRLCVNPEHLEAVTPRENVLRSPIAPAAINARKTHCKRGHEFSTENTRRSPDGRTRSCRTCKRQRAARYRKVAA